MTFLLVLISQSLIYFFWLAILLAVISSLSLLSANEGIRGMGRVSGGLSTVFLGGVLLANTVLTGLLPAQYVFPESILILTGLITVGSGLRKFIRRGIAVG